MKSFTNRVTAGIDLAKAVSANLPNAPHPLILALPRGGVPVAAEVAKAIEGELDLMIVRKLGVPWHPELAMGAIATGGVRILNEDVIQHSGIGEEEIAAVEAMELAELQRRLQAYRGNRPTPQIGDRTVILVDDGIATGATMLAAVAAVRQQHPAMLIVAVPVAPPETIARLEQVADQVIALIRPSTLYAISAWYSDFSQTTDTEVTELLAEAWNRKS